MNLRCPHCQNAFEIIDDQAVDEVTCPSCHSKISVGEILTLHPSQSEGATKTQATTMPLAGESVAHFEITGLMGTGGFGSVFSAFDTRLQRDVAIKIPRLEYVSRRQAEIFIHEARSAAQLRDPNIVSVHEIGRDERFVYIVSDLIDGITLKQWMKQREPTAKESAAMISRIAKAIHKAHGKGIIHRDLKPTNILVDADNEPHITDFGLAKRENPEEMTITVSGEVIGTPAYMSPEQAQGKSDQADGRTDVYSLGVMLYELLTGKRPFRGESDLLIEEVIAGDATPPSKLVRSIPADLEAICLKALSRSLGDRFATSLEFAEDLDRFVSGEPTLTRPPNVFAKCVRQVRKHVVASSFVFLSAIMLVFAALALIANLNVPRRLDVLMETLPPRGDITVVPVDTEMGEIRYDRAVHVSSTTSGPGASTLKLEPGWYLVEASLPNFGLQESWRFVPDDTDSRKITRLNVDLRLTNWKKLGKHRIQWPTLSIQDHGIAGQPIIMVHGMEFVLLPGGVWKLDDQNLSPRLTGSKKVGAFYMSRTEVTCRQYRVVMDGLPAAMQARFDGPIPDDLPVTNVSWFEAMEFAERIGARLPTLEEYVFAATNRGTTSYPWGRGNEQFIDWRFGLVGTPEYDRTQPGTTEDGSQIYNLYSSVAEWTMDVYIPPDADRNNSKSVYPPELLAQMRNSRVVVGGERDVIDGTFAPQNKLRLPTRFGIEPVMLPAGNGLGFRCVLSANPRL